MAIANAIASLAKHAGVGKMKLLVINTDSRYAIERFENPKTELDFYIKGLLALLVTRTKAKYKLKHVVAHNGTSDSRSWVNDWCDKQAKKESRSSTGIGIAEIKMGDGPWNRFTLKPWLYRNKSKTKYEFKAKG